MNQYPHAITQADQRAIFRRKITKLQGEVELLKKKLKAKQKNQAAEIQKSEHLKIMLMSVVAFQQMVDEKKITFNELAILLIAGTNEFFYHSEVKKKLGYIPPYIYYDITAMRKCGLLDYNKKTRYLRITVTGQMRLDAILKYMYGQKLTSFRKPRIKVGVSRKPTRLMDIVNKLREDPEWDESILYEDNN